MKRYFSIFIMLLFAFTLVACVEGEEDTFSVVFYSSGGTYVETIYNLEKGSKIEEPNDPTIIGGAFSGWYKDIETTDKWDFENDTVEESMVLYAKWDLVYYNITYELYGGTFIQGTEINHPATYTIKSPTISFIYSTSTRPTPPEGFTRFRGWWLEEGLTDEELQKKASFQQITTGSTGDITLYAYYRK